MTRRVIAITIVAVGGVSLWVALAATAAPAPAGKPGCGAPTSSPQGGQVTQQQLAELWVQAGGPPAEAGTAAAVGMGESGGRVDARNRCCYGVMQVNLVHAGRFGIPRDPAAARRWLYDPANNMSATVALWRAAGGSWQPWEAYTGPDGRGSDGTWLRYRGRSVEVDAVVCEVDIDPAAATPGDARKVATTPGVILTAGQRQDLLAGGIDARLVTVLAAIGRSHRVVVTAFRRDHRPGTNHEAGRALDIGAVDGNVCNPYGPSDACGQLAVWLARLPDAIRPTELIASFDPDPTDPRDFAQADHRDHIHLGYDE